MSPHCPLKALAPSLDETTYRKSDAGRHTVRAQLLERAAAIALQEPRYCTGSNCEGGQPNVVPRGWVVLSGG